MPQAQFVQDGNAIDYRPGADTPAGTVVVQGDLVAVARNEIKANALGALSLVGVYDFGKIAGNALAVGTVVYWDNVNFVVTATAGALKKAGKVVRAAGVADTIVRVVLLQ